MILTIIISDHVYSLIRSSFAFVRTGKRRLNCIRDSNKETGFLIIKLIEKIYRLLFYTFFRTHILDTHKNPFFLRTKQSV